MVGRRVRLLRPAGSMEAIPVGTPRTLGPRIRGRQGDSIRCPALTCVRLKEPDPGSGPLPRTDGRQPFMPGSVSRTPACESSLRFCLVRRKRPLSVGRFHAPFIQRGFTMPRSRFCVKDFQKNCKRFEIQRPKPEPSSGASRKPRVSAQVRLFSRREKGFREALLRSHQRPSG
jgi:hypothetical protein